MTAMECLFVLIKILNVTRATFASNLYMRNMGNY
jgi:hypothetical protein